ncbi:hypothetical protein [Maricaulis maris]|uniref:Uncharacterized protein n=1 Tax=Maricaulis maris TaxID=74318 RepID=A0A495D3D0_9PROT|nr:hypothetical protein [Maricaulis maris]RKQ96414.1 hypothetical protein C7435_1744 [Maricaulis maris]
MPRSTRPIDPQAPITPKNPDLTTTQGALIGDCVHYECLALKAIHEAMNQQLAKGDSKAAIVSAEILLDRLKSSWLADALGELNEYFRADDNSVRLDMVQTLRDIARMLDGEFGEGMEPNGWARDPDEYHKLLKQAKKQAESGKRKLYVGT